MHTPTARCRSRQSPSTAREHGATLLATLGFITVMSTAAGLAVLSSNHVNRQAQRTRALQSAIATGDAYLEAAFAAWRQTCRANRNMQLAAKSFNPLPAPSATLLSQPKGYSYSNFRIDTMDAKGVVQLESAAPASAVTENPEEDSYLYRAVVDISVPVLGEPVKAKVRRIFEKRMESPWRYAIFYNDTLEIHPSPRFQVDGPVHTNGPIFVSPDSSNPLIFTGPVTHTGPYKPGFSPSEMDPRKKVPPIPAPTYATGLPPAAEVRKTPFDVTPDQFNTTNPNMEGYRELIERPNPNYPDPLTNGDGDNPRFYSSANVKILVDGSNNVTILKADNTVVTAKNNPTFYNAIAPAITTNSVIQDYREAAQVRLVNVNVSKINTSVVGNVVYVADTSAGQTGTGNKRGVRIRNGATLPSGGITFVSENPVYVQGNYNSAGTRQSSAIIGDAIMVLSQNWNDANSSANLTGGQRDATNTTINAAFLSGNIETATGVYSGGVENFPRFMEDWTDVTFTYNGSMVQLFKSKQAIGKWGSSTQSYNPPIRAWAYDTRFRTNPPPGTLYSTTYYKQRWYLE